MKTNIYILFTLLVFTVLLFNSCKKYPKDGHYSLQTVNKRLSGTFILDKYIVNDIDSTNLIPPCVPIKYIDYGVKDGRYYYEFNSKNGLNGMDGGGLYNIINNKNDFRSSYSHVLAGKNILRQTPNGVDCIWHILKLTKSEFWIKQDFNNLTYEVHLKKIHS